MRYTRLVHIDFRHSYYHHNRCEGLALVPTDKTARTLRGYGLLWRPMPAGGTILIGGNSSGNNRALPKGVHLDFLLQLKDPKLPNFTEIEPGVEGKRVIHHFSNTNPQPQLNLEMVQPTRSLFTATHHTPEVEGEIKVKSAKGLVVKEHTVKAENGTLSKAIDLRGFEDGIYTLEWFTNGMASGREVCYVSEMLFHVQVFGILHLQLPDSISPNTPLLYHHQFHARKSPWTYMLHLSKDYSGFDISLEDKNGLSDKIPFAKMSKTGLTEGSTVVFASGKLKNNKFEPNEIPYSDRPGKKLKLTLKKNGKVTALEGLPLPSPYNPKAEIHVNL